MPGCGSQRLDQQMLKDTGASGVICKGTGVQVVYGPRVSVIKSDLEAYLASPASNLAESAPVAPAAEAAPAQTGAATIVASPLTGNVIPLEQIEDGVFSEKMVGEGFAVEPTDNKVYAPADCTVSTVFGTKHAVGLVLDGGVELLIHMGIDTVQLGGAPFEIAIKDGDKLKKGDLIGSFDAQAIIDAGYRTVTPVIVTNSDSYQSFDLLKTGAVEAGEAVLAVK